MKKAKTLFPLPLAALLCAGCLSDSDPADVGSARVRWQGSEPHRYAYVVGMSCFCIGPHGIKVEATRDSVLSAVVNDAGPDQGKPAPRPQSYSIDSLFARAEAAQKDPSHTTRIHFNATYGFPDTLDVDPEQHAVDGGYVLTVSEFKEIAP